jgi:hypothetical protein
MEADTAFIGTDIRIELNPVPTIYMVFTLVFHQGTLKIMLRSGSTILSSIF